MRIYKLGAGAAAAGIYLLAVIISLVLPFAAHSAELGMFAFTLTLPWSFLFSIVINPFLGETAMKSELLGAAIHIISALINAALIYTFAERLSKIPRSKIVYK